MAHEAKGKHKEIYPQEQKHVGVKSKEPRRKTKQSRWRRPGTSARNKRKSIEDKGNRGEKQNRGGGEGLGLVLGTKESQSEGKGNRGAKQNKSAGEGLELVLGTKESQSEGKGNRGEKQNIAGGEGLQLVRGTEGSQSEENDTKENSKTWFERTGTSDC